MRRNLTPDDWKQLVARDPTIRAWRFFLSADPYTRWGLLKPRGYPGDASLMDFAYGHASVKADIDMAGDVGNAIYRHTAGSPMSASARLRVDLIAKRLHARAAERRQFTAISIASGHARELEALDDASKGLVELFTAVDVDPLSLSRASQSAAAIPLNAVKRNVLKHDLSDLKPATLVYSLGLFDYLDQTSATAVLSRMWSLVARGGEMIIANLAHDAANLGYCEAIMDWWMIPRGASDMNALGDFVAGLGDLESPPIVSRHGCFYYLELIKRA